MIRILYVSTSTTVGGAEKTLYTLATLLDPAVFEVVGVVSLKPMGKYAKMLQGMGRPVHSLELHGAPNLQSLQALAGIIAQTRPFIVHAVMYQAMQLSRAVKTLGYADFMLVTSPRVHYRTRSGFSLWIDARLMDADDLLITESDASKTYLEQKLGYDPDRLQTIYNGVDVAGWTPSKPQRARIRKELGVGPTDVLIGAVGRLDEQKGHAYLIEAVAKLRATHPVRCVILGEGPLRQQLEGFIAKLGVGDAVRLAGEIADIPSWLGALDIFALPSVWEGLPNALLEAMGMGLPVVAARVDGVPEVVQHDVNGLLCEPKDSQALFVPLQDLALDSALRRRLGDAAKATISSRFKLADMLSAYEAAYQKLAADPPPPEPEA